MGLGFRLGFRVLPDDQLKQTKAVYHHRVLADRHSWDNITHAASSPDTPTKHARHMRCENLPFSHQLWPKDPNYALNPKP